jgi:TonB family protein
MMLESQRPAAENRNRRSMLITLGILLVTLVVVLVMDRAIWFGSEETSDVDEPSPTSTSASTSVPKSVVPAPAVVNPAPTAKKKNEVVAKNSAEPTPAGTGTTVVAATRTELPPMEVEVVAGDTHRVVHPGSNSVKVEMPPNSGSRVAASTAFTWSPATNAAERTRLSADQPDALPPSAETSYPSLAKEMKVQGSVLLQAFVGTDGGIRHLRVLSGNPILVSAALEAARQWRFTPYLQNGQPVETQAKIMVNFTIKVL